MAILDFFNKRVKDDKAEMTFIDHLEELRWHLLRSVVAVVIGAIVEPIAHKALVPAFSSLKGLFKAKA